MADLKIAKVVVKSGINGPVPGSTMAKAGPSKFDAIRSQIAERVAADVKLPPLAVPTSQQTASIESALRKQLERTETRSAKEFFRVEMKNTGVGMEKLAQSVEKLPKQSAFTPIRERLNVMEQQFQKSGELIQNMKDFDPKSLLKAQLQIYQMSENIGLLSKVVDQVSAGAKTIMQTQV